MTEPLLGQIRKSTKITVVAQSVSKQALNLNFSTRGFSDATPLTSPKANRDRGHPVKIVQRIGLPTQRRSLTSASTGSNCDCNATLGKEADHEREPRKWEVSCLSPSNVPYQPPLQSTPKTAASQSARAFSKGKSNRLQSVELQCRPRSPELKWIHSLRKKVVAIPLAVTPIGSAVAKLVVAEQGGLALGAPLSSTGQGGRCVDRSAAWRLLSARRSGSSEVHLGILQNHSRPVRAPRRDHDRNDQIDARNAMAKR